MNDARSSKAASRFLDGDLVWGKMKGFPPWPGKIETPPETNKKTPMKKGNFHWIYFFGSHDYAPILENDLQPYHEFKKTFSSGKKLGNIKNAIVEAEEYIKNYDIVSPTKICPSLIVTPTSSKIKPSNATSSEDTEFDALFGISRASGSKRRSVSNGTDGKSNKIQKKKMPSAKKTLMSHLTKGKKKGTDVNGQSAPSNRWSLDIEQVTSSTRGSTVNAFLDRPSIPVRPVSPTLGLSHTTVTTNRKDLTPSTLKFGFIGLGIMGSGIAKNLVQSGHSVSVWNRGVEKADALVLMGAKKCLTPGDVVSECDITFSCLSDPDVAKEIVFGNCGVLSEMNTCKSYVEMTGMDSSTSLDICEAISVHGGRYLEAQLQGSKDQAANGTLTILTAGDKSLYDECQSCFMAMGTYSTYLGEVGNACKVFLVLQGISGVCIAGLAEGMALADRAGVQNEELLRIISHTRMKSALIMEKGQAIIDGQFRTKEPLSHLQKDIKLLISMGDKLEQPLPVSAATNESYKHAKRLGYGEHDTAAVYIRTRY